jgi:hypothetical protein
VTLHHPLCAGLLAACLVAWGCGHDGGQDPSGATLEISVSTIGEEPDADGYTVQIDARSARPIPETITQANDVAPGEHSIYIGAVANNCTVQGANPRLVSVPAEGIRVLIQVVCSARTGSVLVTLRTQGVLPFPSGQTIALDEVERAKIDTGTALITGVTRGTHLVRLRGVPDNCTVVGNPRGVIILPEETRSIEFAISCVALHGTLEVDIDESGPTNPNGYFIQIAGGRTYRMPGAGSIGITNVAAGFQQVELVNLPTNCSVEGANPATVNIRAGGWQRFTFTVLCN